MQIADLLSPDGVVAALKANGKKQLLQELSARAASLIRLPERRIFETLNERERLGTTGVGQGIAVPHGRLADIEKITGVFARLETPIEYEAVDGQPVDLVFMLLAPEGAGADHLKALGAGFAPAAQPVGLRKTARRQIRRGALRYPHGTIGQREIRRSLVSLTVFLTRRGRENTLLP